ncbi:helix-turn-helix domain-containing protein [Flavobacterium poyangense]|uniref:helix-turn-helix domain-containing protein n=1 Tax=Flavobacterium poyangense TaxID=2204302 RepID=UPI001423ACD4|nr:AraC family transcriptional regulator [Flavobacterium sp. JXAS1]
MTLRLYDLEFSTLLMEKEYPKSFYSSTEEVEESVICLEHFMGKGVYKEIYFEGVHIAYGDAMLSNKVQLGFESDFETIEMHFALKGSSTTLAENFDSEISFEPHRHNIIYANKVCGEMKWESNQLQLCEINLAPSFFKKFLPPGSPIFDNFRNTVEKGNSGLLKNENLYITNEMYDIINQIVNCQRQGIFKRMFLEAKVIELLLLQLEQFSENSVSNFSIKKSDIDKIYAVREFILHNLDSASSLIELAHNAGTNEFILKKGFRELFGTSVFAFWSDVKMEQAKDLLINHNMNIGEVSQLVGYKYQRHFSAAFKKKYGMLPSQFRK